MAAIFSIYIAKGEHNELIDDMKRFITCFIDRKMWLQPMNDIVSTGSRKMWLQPMNDIVSTRSRQMWLQPMNDIVSTGSRQMWLQPMNDIVSTYWK